MATKRIFQVLRKKGTTRFYQHRWINEYTGEWFQSLSPTLIPGGVKNKAFVEQHLYPRAYPLPEDMELVKAELKIIED